MNIDRQIAHDRRKYVLDILSECDMTADSILRAFERRNLEPGVTLDRIKDAIYHYGFRVAGWEERTTLGGKKMVVAVYSVTDGPDVPRPAAKSKAQIKAQYVERKKRFDSDAPRQVIKAGYSISAVSDPFALPAGFFGRAA